MSGDRDKYTACYNCGTLNVTGIKWCVNCYAAQYYNCPYCQSWVDNSFPICPGCGKKLRWPSEGYYTEYAFSPNKSTSSAVVVLLLCIAVLSIVTVNLIANNSNPVDAIARTPDVAISSNPPASELKTAAQPFIQVLNSVTPTPSMAQTDPATSYSDSETATAEASNAYLIINATATNPVSATPVSATSTGTYVPQPSSYLKTIAPNWGRCSGGSCSGYYQYSQ